MPITYRVFLEGGRGVFGTLAWEGPPSGLDAAISELTEQASKPVNRESDRVTGFWIVAHGDERISL